MTLLETEIAAINSNLLYVPEGTISSLDDDHLRLSSRDVSNLTNLQHINNPKEWLGPACNALCSALCSFFLVGDITRKGEQIIHVWVRLVQLLQGAPARGTIASMTDAIFASEMGYCCPESIKFINEELHASDLGTQKRSLDFPFIF